MVSLMFILLFVYAAVSKALGFENFQVQIGQSPMLSAFADFVSVGIIIIEIIASVLLVFQKTRLIGLYLSFFLMVMFTTYIVIILNFSSFVPCSCGGVLEKMSWTEHLIFNVCFTILAALGVLLMKGFKGNGNNDNKKINTRKKTLLSTLIFSVVVVVGLFLLSEDIIHKRNNFIRRFPQHPLVLKSQLDLKYSSYYIAGVDIDNIYLGNRTAWLHLKILNKRLEEIEEKGISISNLDLPFRSPTITVSSPNFYFVDGYVPVIFKGKTRGWEANVENTTKAFFSLSASIDSDSFVIRARDSKTNENLLGILNIGDSSSLKLSRSLLEKQIDGVFDTDGSLLYNKQLEKLIYTYYYRNQYIVADKKLELDHRGRTIDTTTKAQIKVKYISQEKGSKLSTPPLVVNKYTATYGNYLFINSNLMGRFEPRETWNSSSVVDVYDLVENRYVLSFYIPNIGKENLTEFHVQDNQLVCLVGQYIQIYELDGRFLDLPPPKNKDE